MSAVISEGQKVFKEAVLSVMSAALGNLVGGRGENMSREKERGNRAQDYSTTQEVASSAQAEEDSFEAGLWVPRQTERGQDFKLV